MRLIRNLLATVRGSQETPADVSLGHPTTYEGMNYAVLDEVQKHVPFLNATMAWLGDVSRADIARVRAKVALLREWAMALSDTRIRDEYLRWIAHAERGANEAERELDEGRIAKSQAKYNEKVNREFALAGSWESRIPRPERSK